MYFLIFYKKYLKIMCYVTITMYPYRGVESEINLIVSNLMALDVPLSNEKISKYLHPKGVNKTDIHNLNLKNFKNIFIGSNFYDFIYIYCTLKGNQS